LATQAFWESSVRQPGLFIGLEEGSGLPNVVLSVEAGTRQRSVVFVESDFV
jgi:hypothetical protein